MTPKYPPEKHAEFERLCDEYFNDCDNREAPYTIPGLAYYLGFESRFSILNYKGKPKFDHTIKKARARIEQQRVENLVAGKGSAPGQIFDLKNNFDYKDKVETETYGKGGGPIETKNTIELVRADARKDTRAV
jgi:hypothetical protein